MLSGNLQHLVHEGEIRNIGGHRRCRLGRRVLFILDEFLDVLLDRLVLRFGSATDERASRACGDDAIEVIEAFAMNL
jgi:hypothetical protein